MVVTVYAIRFESGEMYVGMSSDLNRRFEEHARRQSQSTKKFEGAFGLIYSKDFNSYAEARRPADHVPGNFALDRARSRHRATRAYRLRPDPAGCSWSSALFPLRPGSAVAAPPFDVLQVVLVVSALLADAVALWAIAARITEFGFTPNRVAALGENMLLLVNLVWSAVLYLRFLRGRGSFASLEKWQTNYLTVYFAWGAIVVVIFPPLFRYI